MVEIFKTNVNNKAIANMILENLLGEIPTAEINFDLEDCDKILRIKDENICADNIIHLLGVMGFECEILF